MANDRANLPAVKYYVMHSLIRITANRLPVKFSELVMCRLTQLKFLLPNSQAFTGQKFWFEMKNRNGHLMRQYSEAVVRCQHQLRYVAAKSLH